MQFERRDRIVELIREELAVALRKVKDPRLSGFLTITGVELSKDMKTATAFYSILGTEHEKEQSSAALNSAVSFVRFQLKSRLSLKVIPVISFEYDNTPERAGRVLELLSAIEKEAEQFPPSPNAAPEPEPEPEAPKTPPGVKYRKPRKPRKKA